MDENKNKFMPFWAQKVDGYSRTKWHKEKTFSRIRSESIGAIIWNLVFLFIVNKVPDWNLTFIRDNYGAVLWILNINILIQIAGNLLMVLFDFSWIRYLSRIILETANFLTTMVLFYVYPFDFSHVRGLEWIDWLLHIGFIIAMVVSALKVISNIWKLLFWR